MFNSPEFSPEIFLRILGGSGRGGIVVADCKNKMEQGKGKRKNSQCKKKVVSGIEPGTYPYATQ